MIPQSVEVKTGAGEYRRNDILINGAAWAVSCLTVALPPEAAVQIVKDVGYLPVEAVKVQKGEANQLMMAGIAAERYDMLQEQRGDVLPMKKIPVIFKDRWQLYQTIEGSVHAFDTALLQLIDKDYEKSCSCFMWRWDTLVSSCTQIPPCIWHPVDSLPVTRRRSCTSPVWTGSSRSSTTTRRSISACSMRMRTSPWKLRRIEDEGSP